MVKKPLGGRPGVDPEDLKTVRISIRLHPDMFDALAVLARRAGLNRSVAAQRILIAAINADAGYDLLDAIGRRIDHDKPPVVRSGIALLRGLEYPRGVVRPTAPAPKKR